MAWNRAVCGPVDGDGGETQLWLRVHSQAIRARGAWIGGAIDPASRGRSGRWTQTEPPKRGGIVFPFHRGFGGGGTRMGRADGAAGESAGGLRVHAQAIRARGAWVCGAIDPASRGRSQVDGRQLWQMYTDLGLKLDTADNAVEAGV